MNWEDVKKELSKKLDPANVKPPPKGKYGEYIEGVHAIYEANRIFGFDGWSCSTDRLDVTNEESEGGKHRVGYIAIVSVCVDGVKRSGTGHGQGFGKSLGDAHDSAAKEAETDALKRALRTFGNPFGLALYDKTKANVGRDVPVEVMDAVSGAETLEALATVWHANKEWQTHPDFQAEKDKRKSDLEAAQNIAAQ